MCPKMSEVKNTHLTALQYQSGGYTPYTPYSTVMYPKWGTHTLEHCNVCEVDVAAQMCPKWRKKIHTLSSVMSEEKDTHFTHITDVSSVIICPKSRMHLLQHCHDPKAHDPKSNKKRKGINSYSTVMSLKWRETPICAL